MAVPHLLHPCLQNAGRTQKFTRAVDVVQALGIDQEEGDKENRHQSDSKSRLDQGKSGAGPG
jgi:hypothetical protein